MKEMNLNGITERVTCKTCKYFTRDDPDLDFYKDYMGKCTWKFDKSRLPKAFFDAIGSGERFHFIRDCFIDGNTLDCVCWDNKK